jgi:hypothetical protein
MRKGEPATHVLAQNVASSSRLTTPQTAEASPLRIRQVSWLVTPFLPPFPFRRRNSGQCSAKTYALLTVARQLVICTRFPVTSRNAKPYPVDEAIQCKKSVADFEAWNRVGAAQGIDPEIPADA